MEITISNDKLIVCRLVDRSGSLINLQRNLNKLLGLVWISIVKEFYRVENIVSLKFRKKLIRQIKFLVPELLHQLVVTKQGVYIASMSLVI